MHNGRKECSMSRKHILVLCQLDKGFQVRFRSTCQSNSSLNHLDRLLHIGIYHQSYRNRHPLLRNNVLVHLGKDGYFEMHNNMLRCHLSCENVLCTFLDIVRCNCSRFRRLRCNKEYLHHRKVQSCLLPTYMYFLQ